MIKDQKKGKKQELVKKFESSKDIDMIKKELAEYQAKEKEKTISDILLESHNFFNELDSVLGIIISDLKKDTKKH